VLVYLVAFECLWVLQQLVSLSKEKSEQLKTVTTISAEEHAEELRNIQEWHVGELQKLCGTKNMALQLQEQRGMCQT